MPAAGALPSMSAAGLIPIAPHFADLVIDDSGAVPGGGLLPPGVSPYGTYVDRLPFEEDVRWFLSGESESAKPPLTNPADGLVAVLWGPCARWVTTNILMDDVGAPDAYSFPLNWVEAMTYPGTASSEPVTTVNEDGSLMVVTQYIPSCVDIETPSDFADFFTSVADGLEVGVTSAFITVYLATQTLPGLGIILSLYEVAALLNFTPEVNDVVSNLRGVPSGPLLNNSLRKILLALDGLGAATMAAVDTVGIEVTANENDPCPELDLRARFTGLTKSQVDALAKALATSKETVYERSGAPVVTVRASESWTTRGRIGDLIDYASATLVATGGVGAFALQTADDSYKHGGRSVRVDVVTDSLFQVPTMHLPASLMEFYFNGYAYGYYPVTALGEWPHGDDISGYTASTKTSAHPRTYQPQRRQWADMASPMLQFMDTLRLATVMFRELVNMECGVAAFSGLASTTGVLGDLLRKALTGFDTSCFIELFGGVSLSGVIALVWRQQMLDTFLVNYAFNVIWPGEGPEDLEHPVALDYDDLAAEAPGLFELVCWMNSSTRRADAEAIFGTLQAQYVKPDYFVALRSGGVLSGILAGIGNGSACGAWKDLPCTTREELTKYARQLSTCEPTFFSDDFGTSSSHETYWLSEPKAAAAAERRAAGDHALRLDVSSTVSLQRDLLAALAAAGRP